MKFTFAFLVLIFTAFQASALEAFHNLPADQYEARIDDWERRGLGASALHVNLTTAGVFTSGVYDEASKENVTRMVMNLQSFRKTNENMKNEYNYAPSSLSVYIHAGRLPMYSAVYSPEKVPTHIEEHMGDQRFNEKWQEWVVQKGYRVAEHVVYNPGVGRRHGVIFVKDGREFIFLHGLNRQQFDQRNRDYTALGFFPETIAVEEVASPTYSAVWTKPKESAVIFYYDISSDEYQRHFNELTGQGYRLKQVRSYRNGSLFSGIWVR